MNTHSVQSSSSVGGAGRWGRSVPDDLASHSGRDRSAASAVPGVAPIRRAHSERSIKEGLDLGYSPPRGPSATGITARRAGRGIESGHGGGSQACVLFAQRLDEGPKPVP